ncbi:alkaline phosphatase family protein [Alicyclobacillus sp. SO9]|uniref:alkaline phosphatase family protein n=1 Tax=Alicyclobacillus sp. SO9 TaxID=2665646 RepID=UPI0018E754CA|nr:alkaline phosphatase family protein [Alicyclobacillus sp. SO9]
MRNPALMVSALAFAVVITTGCGNANRAVETANKGSNPRVTQTGPTQNKTVGGQSNSSRSGTGTASSTNTARPAKPTRPDHIVVVVEENHGYNRIVGNKHAPYINSLIRNGALFTNYHAVAHPSQPNYLALFAGSTLGIHSDSCPHTFTQANLGSELTASNLSFTGYAESLPSVGFTGCSTRTYARKHAPWVDFSNLARHVNRPFSSFSNNFTKLPTVSFVIPNVKNDMHSGSVAAGDAWLKNNLGAYASWAKSHNSLLFITFDEGYGLGNRVATVFYGAGVKTGKYGQSFTHYSLLRTIESLYHLSPLGKSKQAKPMTTALAYG